MAGVVHLLLGLLFVNYLLVSASAEDPTQPVLYRQPGKDFIRSILKRMPDESLKSMLIEQFLYSHRKPDDIRIWDILQTFVCKIYRCPADGRFSPFLQFYRFGQYVPGQWYSLGYEELEQLMFLRGFYLWPFIDDFTSTLDSHTKRHQLAQPEFCEYLIILIMW